MEKLYKKMNNYMKKIPNFAWITIIIITTALMFCTILTSVGFYINMDDNYINCWVQ